MNNIGVYEILVLVGVALIVAVLVWAAYLAFRKKGAVAPAAIDFLEADDVPQIPAQEGRTARIWTIWDFVAGIAIAGLIFWVLFLSNVNADLVRERDQAYRDAFRFQTTTIQAIDRADSAFVRADSLQAVVDRLVGWTGE